MAKILLIHGYGTGNPVYNKKERYYQFLGFKKLIDAGEAVVFEWFEKEDYHNFEFLNPIHHFLVYQKERLLAGGKKSFESLSEALKLHKPKTIICHSMGSYLLLNYLKDAGLPDFVEKVIFIQADVPQSFQMPDDVEKRLKNHQLTWENYYCHWDFALIASLFINGYIPAGLVGASSELIKNRFYPLHSYILLHISSIRSEKFIKKLLNIS